MKYSKIIIAQGDLVLILAGDDTNRLQARRKTQNQEITLKVSLNKDGTMDIEEQENISERSLHEMIKADEDMSMSINENLLNEKINQLKNYLLK